MAKEPGRSLNSPSTRAEKDGAVDAATLQIAERLALAVRGAGGNQIVASLAGVPLATVNNYVRGRNGMKLDALMALAGACRVSLDWLATGTRLADRLGPQGGLGDAPDGPRAAAVDVQLLVRAIEVVEAVAGFAAFKDDAKELARRIAGAYAVLARPETAEP